MSTLKPTLISIAILLTVLESTGESTDNPTANVSPSSSEMDNYSCSDLDVHVSDDRMEMNVTMPNVTTDTCDHTVLRMDCDGHCTDWWNEIIFDQIDPDHQTEQNGLISCKRSINITNPAFVDCTFGLIITNSRVETCGNFSAPYCELLPHPSETTFSRLSSVIGSVDINTLTENSDTSTTANENESFTVVDSNMKKLVIGGAVSLVGLIALLLVCIPLIYIIYKNSRKRTKKRIQKSTPERGFINQAPSEVTPSSYEVTPVRPYVQVHQTSPHFAPAPGLSYSDNEGDDMYCDLTVESDGPAPHDPSVEVKNIRQPEPGFENADSLFDDDIETDSGLRRQKKKNPLLESDSSRTGLRQRRAWNVDQEKMHDYSDSSLSEEDYPREGSSSDTDS